MTGELKNFKKSAAKTLVGQCKKCQAEAITDGLCVQHYLNHLDEFERRSAKAKLVVGSCFICKNEGATQLLPAAPPDYKVLPYHPNCLAIFGI